MATKSRAPLPPVLPTDPAEASYRVLHGGVSGTDDRGRSAVHYRGSIRSASRLGNGTEADLARLFAEGAIEAVTYGDEADETATDTTEPATSGTKPEA